MIVSRCGDLNFHEKPARFNAFLTESLLVCIDLAGVGNLFEGTINFQWTEPEIAREIAAH